MRGNRTIKVSASELDAFHSPNMLPLAKMGINIDVDYRAIHRYQNKKACWFYDFTTVNFFLWDAPKTSKLNLTCMGFPVYVWNLEICTSIFLQNRSSWIMCSLLKKVPDYIANFGALLGLKKPHTLNSNWCLWHYQGSTKKTLTKHRDSYSTKNVFNRPTAIEKFTVHTSLNRNVVVLRIFPSMRKETVEHFFQPPIEGVILQCYGAGN